MAYTVAEVATEILDEMDITDVTQSQVESWIRGNVGKLNLLINRDFKLVNEEYDPEITEDVKAIIKCMYAVRYFKNIAKNSLSNATSQIISVTDDVSSVRFTNANEVAKVFRETYKDEQEKLDEMAMLWKMNRAVPTTYVAPSLINTIAPPHYEMGDGLTL